MGQCYSCQAKGVVTVANTLPVQDMSLTSNHTQHSRSDRIAPYCKPDKFKVPSKLPPSRLPRNSNEQPADVNRTALRLLNTDSKTLDSSKTNGIHVNNVGAGRFGFGYQGASQGGNKTRSSESLKSSGTAGDTRRESKLRATSTSFIPSGGTERWRMIDDGSDTKSQSTVHTRTPSSPARDLLNDNNMDTNGNSTREIPRGNKNKKRWSYSKSKSKTQAQKLGSTVNNTAVQAQPDTWVKAESVELTIEQNDKIVEDSLVNGKKKSKKESRPDKESAELPETSNKNISKQSNSDNKKAEDLDKNSKSSEQPAPSNKKRFGFFRGNKRNSKKNSKDLKLKIPNKDEEDKKSTSSQDTLTEGKSARHRSSSMTSSEASQHILEVERNSTQTVVEETTASSPQSGDSAERPQTLPLLTRHTDTVLSPWQPRAPLALLDSSIIGDSRNMTPVDAGTTETKTTDNDCAGKPTTDRIGPESEVSVPKHDIPTDNKDSDTINTSTDNRESDNIDNSTTDHIVSGQTEKSSNTTASSGVMDNSSILRSRLRTMSTMSADSNTSINSDDLMLEFELDDELAASMSASMTASLMSTSLTGGSIFSPVPYKVTKPEYPTSEVNASIDNNTSEVNSTTSLKDEPLQDINQDQVHDSAPRPRSATVPALDSYAEQRRPGTLGMVRHGSGRRNSSRGRHLNFNSMEESVHELSPLVQQEERSGRLQRNRPASFPGPLDAADPASSRGILRAPRQMSVADDEEITMDGGTFRHLQQDITTFKTMLFKLKRSIQEEDIGSPMTTSGSWKNGFKRDAVLTPDSPLVRSGDVFAFLDQTNTGQDKHTELIQENDGLRQQIGNMQKQMDEQERTIKLLQAQMTKYECGEFGPGGKQQSNATTQTDKPRTNKGILRPATRDSTSSRTATLPATSTRQKTEPLIRYRKHTPRFTGSSSLILRSPVGTG